MIGYTLSAPVTEAYRRVRGETGSLDAAVEAALREQRPAAPERAGTPERNKANQQAAAPAGGALPWTEARTEAPRCDFPPLRGHGRGAQNGAVTGRWEFWIDRGGTFTDIVGRRPKRPG
ncbi:hypothetical protein SBADM41S_11725 [Streptomyces badius]